MTKPSLPIENPRATFDESTMELFDFHHSMLRDRTRIEAFMKAISLVVQPGDVVVDLGTGTGILAVMAAKSGAGKVYAIETEAIIEIAEAVAAANDVADRIEFVSGTSTEVELPELGDVLVTETIGNAGFDEGILVWVRDARSRLLKPDARVVPHQITLQAALLELPSDYAELDRLLDPVFGFDLSPLRDLVVGRMAWDLLSPVSVVSETADLITVSLDDPPSGFSIDTRMSPRRQARVHGVGFWFDALVAPGVRLSNSPTSATPSWNQGVFMLDQPMETNTSDEAELSVTVTAGGEWEVRVSRR